MNSDQNKGKLGIWMSTSLVVGNMIGSGIFLMPSALAAFGGISILGWLVSSIGALMLAKVFSRLSRLIPGRSGGPYAFARAGFGDFIGFLVAWGYWMSTWIANAAIAVAFVGAMSIFFPILDTEPLAAVGLTLSAIWFLTWINSRGVVASGKTQIVTTLLKLLPILVVIAGGIFFFQLDNFSPFNASGESSLKAIALSGTLTLFAFLGLESATVPSDKVADAARTIPRATLLGTGFTTLVYIMSTVVIMGLIPLDQLAESPSPFADAMRLISGEYGEALVAAGAAIASFGALNGWILIQSQIAEAAAKDGLFPPVFKKENRRGVPVWGMVIGSSLSSLMALMNFTENLVEQFSFMILLSTLCTLVPYLFAAAAYVGLSLERITQRGPAVRVFLLGGLAFSFSLWAVYGAGEASVFWGFLLLLLGVPVYILMRWKNRKNTDNAQS
jgi:APA family basic amino acid/polyamine antiporter